MTTAYVTHLQYAKHDLQGHPEHAGRIKAVWSAFEDTNLTQRLHVIEPSPATTETLGLVHTPKYLALLEQIPTLKQIALLDADTYATPNSYHIARLSAGGVIRAVDEVLNGSARNALAAMRPPGHHALADRAMGFCLLGNIAIAARHAQLTHGIERVLIVDYDVHHGNGTQAMFYDDPSVMFVSLHQSPFYPGSGLLNETGTGKGIGYTLNIPLAAGHGNESYAALFEQVIWPAARQFKPQLILVSAGFDAHWTDPLASMRLSLSGYAHITRELVLMANQLCGGRIVFVMEGGYDLLALANGVRNIAHALLGEDEISDPLGPALGGKEPDVASLIDHLQTIHKIAVD